MTRQLFFLSQITRVLWVRATIWALAAVAAALLARLIGPLVPPRWVESVGKDPLEELLKIMASSMLAVATFSLTALVAAYGSLTANASPRAAALLIEDKSAQTALSSFVAAFIFSIVAMIALGTGAFDASARFVLFCETLFVLALVVLRLLRWIDQVSHLGRIGKAVDQIEEALVHALAHRAPFLGGVPDGEPPPHATPIYAEKVGYVQHLDIPHLQHVADQHDLMVHAVVLPGSFARRSRPMLMVEGLSPADHKAAADLLKGVVIGDGRTFQQDPRFGLVVLSEVASRALSPAVNDPGTAIDVIGTASRILSTWAAQHWEEEPRTKYPRVGVPGLSAADCFEDVFAPIARDGARHVEVGIALQEALADLAEVPAPGFAAAAAHQSAKALARAELALDLDEDKRRLRALAVRPNDPPTAADAAAAGSWKRPAEGPHPTRSKTDF